MMVQGIDLSCDFNGFQVSAFPNLWNACELYTHLPYGYSTQPDTGTIYTVQKYENKPKFRGGGGLILFMVYLGYKKNCNFFFTLIIHDKMVNEDNFS